MKLTNFQPCTFVEIPGSIRDLPSVWVRKCFDCGHLTDKEDLSRNINYVDGSMHRWAAGHSENAPKEIGGFDWKRKCDLLDFRKRELTEV